MEKLQHIAEVQSTESLFVYQNLLVRVSRFKRAGDFVTLSQTFLLNEHHECERNSSDHGIHRGFQVYQPFH